MTHLVSDSALPEKARGWSDRLARVEENLAGGMVALMLALVAVQVVARRAGWPLVWSEEASIYLFTTLTLVGASAATARRLHVRLTLFVDMMRLPEKFVRTMDFVMALSLLALIPGALRCGEAVSRLGFRSPAMGLPMELIYGLAPASLLLMALHLLAPPAPAPDDSAAELQR